MQSVLRPANRLLQVLPAAEFQSLRPHLETVELAKGAVLTEAGAPIQNVYLPHSGVVSMMVSLSEGQTVEVAMVGCDSLVGGSTAFDDGPALTDATVRRAGHRFRSQGRGASGGRRPERHLAKAAGAT
jgi:CRP-like cAMP-binding protein